MHSRVAAIYDVHGNVDALRSVLDQVRNLSVEHLVVGGDIYPGPFANESLGLLLECGISSTFIHGNGDREVLARFDGRNTAWYLDATPERQAGIDYCAQNLDRRFADEMRNWPSSVELEIATIGRTYFCHATANNDVEVFTKNWSNEAINELFDQVHPEARACICGHTHMQFDRNLGDRRVVNAGSVGMPFGDRGAYWLLLDGDLLLQRTEYDYEQAAERITSSEFPDSESFAKNSVLNPVDESTVLAMFDNMNPSQSSRSHSSE